MRKFRTLLALCLILLGVVSAMAAGERTFKDFTIDLTKGTPVLPEGVTQVSYPQNGASDHGDAHGWCWYAIKFAVDGPVRITLGGCQYANAGQGYVTDEAGNKLGDIDTKTAGCYHNGGTANWEYAGEAETLVVYCGEYCPMIKVEAIDAPAPQPEATGFQGFTIDLTKGTPTLPAGVTQVSYPQNGASDHGDAHGWCWYAIKFAVEGPVKITLGGCQYANAGQGYVTDEAGNKLGDIDTKTAGCYHNGGTASWDYTGKAATLVVYCGEYCPMIKVEKTEATEEPEVDPSAPTIKEKALYKTKFQDWDAVASSTTETNVEKNTTDDQAFTFSLMETQVQPEGTNPKFSAECITPGYLMAAKTATPYIKTSTLQNITKVKFVHSATGGSRGWGLKVKGEGDADWVTVSDEYADQKGTEVTVDVNRTNVQLWFYNLNSSQNAYMTSLEIYGNVEVAPRAFTDFKIDFRTDPYTVVAPEKGLPKNVTLDAGKYHGTQHGAQNAKVTVPVDGPVKFTIGGCQYTSNVATVSIDGGDPISIDTKAAGCDNGFGTYTKSATYTYNAEKAATLTFNLGEYCPYFFAEACDFIPSVVVAYYNTDGKLIGEETVAGNSELSYKYSASDVTVPEGQAFRGWFENKSASAQKVKEGKALTEDIKLFAKTTPIEVAKLGATFTYQLNSTAFYPEDHELFETTGTFHDGQHGFGFGQDQSVSVKTAGNALLVFTVCQYGNASSIIVKDAAGNEVCDPITLPVEKDGTTVSVTYNGDPTTLTATFTNGGYLHALKVYNVSSIPTKNENGYFEVAANDGAALLLVLATLKEGDKIFLPNGTYDLGETVLTTISANNVSIIGESMDKTIIRNAPDKAIEGIGTTATLLNTSKNLYLQDLTIQNALDYYACGGTGRAVCLQDKGENTICKNVKMLSYQDTYYSNSASNFYWEDSEIHGTVDYLCGDGDVIYNRCKLVNESRAKNSESGEDVVCAPYTSENKSWGYVFLDCSIESKCESYTFARAWGGFPKAQFIRTKLLDNALAGSRFKIAGMNVAADKFTEYKTVNSVGKVCTPESNIIEFTHSTGNKKFETVLSDEQAADYTVANIFGEWAPDQIAAQVTDKDAGTVFLVNGKITSERPTEGSYRIANDRGGFGPTINLSDYLIDGKDITDQYIKNADLADGLNDWTATNFNAPVKQGHTNNATEAYAGWSSITVKDYALTQTITLPAGSYKLVNNSYFRQGETYNTNAEKSLAFLKAGEDKTLIKALGSVEAEDYANDQTVGAGVISSNIYVNELEFTLKSETAIEIGIVGTFDEAKSWFITGGFKLYDMNQKSEMVDLTKLIANHSFENGTKGWDVEGEWNVAKTDKKEACVGTAFIEKWQNESLGALAAAKISQTISDLENGKYIVKVNAIATADGAKFFANDESIDLPTNGTAEIISIEVEVTDGKLTFGIERTAENKASGVAFDNFQLFLIQDVPTAIDPVTVNVETTTAAPKKFFKNNQLIIVKNGKMYNAAGIEIK